MQIRYETMKLTKHPTNNRSSPEWFPCPNSWVVHIPSRKHNLMQVRPAGYPISLVASLDTVPGPSEMLCPPALGLKRERTEGRKREKFYIYSDVTHTRPARAGSTLKGKRKKKADTRRAKGQKQRRGGRGTDGPPEPTYTAKRTWPKQRTHLNPTTHYGEARGGIRDQMGD